MHERAIFYYSLAALLLGGQFMSIGFLAELITAYHGRDQDNYSIAEQTPDASEQPSEEPRGAPS